jgi:hypothetical protein
MYHALPKVPLKRTPRNRAQLLGPSKLSTQRAKFHALHQYITRILITAFVEFYGHTVVQSYGWMENDLESRSPRLATLPVSSPHFEIGLAGSQMKPILCDKLLVRYVIWNCVSSPNWVVSVSMKLFICSRTKPP